MGAWGEEIFENDDALDCLGDVVNGFIESIDEWFDYVAEDVEDYANAYEGNIGPLIFILEKLCKNCPADPPVPSKIREWQSKFFSAYDKHAAVGWGKESADMRKELFKKEFSNLLELSIQYHGDIPNKLIYSEGTCLAIKLYIGGYGAAIVLCNERHDEHISTLICGLKGVYDEVPGMEVFEQRDWLYLSHHNFKNELDLVWTEQKDLMESKDQIIVVGSTDIRKTDPSADIDEVGVSYGSIAWIENQIWKQNEWDSEKE